MPLSRHHPTRTAAVFSPNGMGRLGVGCGGGGRRPQHGLSRRQERRELRAPQMKGSVPQHSVDCGEGRGWGCGGRRSCQDLAQTTKCGGNPPALPPPPAGRGRGCDVRWPHAAGRKQLIADLMTGRPEEWGDDATRRSRLPGSRRGPCRDRVGQAGLCRG